MSKFKHWGLAAGLLAVAATVFPGQALGQRSAVEIWSANCGRCHTIQPPNRYSAEDWASIATHMMITARLTAAEGDAVRGFLIAGARTVGTQAAAAPAPESVMQATVASFGNGMAWKGPDTVYAQYCAACHGVGAKGDGPAAVAFDPKPVDMSVPEFWAGRTDAQVDSVLVSGKGAMPPLGETIEPEVRLALIRYLREKYGGKVTVHVEKTEGSSR